MNRSLACLFAVSFVAIAACSKKEEPAADTASATAAASAAPSAKSLSTAIRPPVMVGHPTTVIAPSASAAASAAPTPNPTDGAAFRACCAALRTDGAGNAAKKGDYDLAAKTCDSLAASVAAGTAPRSTALTSLRAAAVRVGTLPAACK